MTQQPRIWVLADDRTGNATQAIGVAEALGLPFEIKEIHYDRRGRLPNLLRGASLLGVEPASRDVLTPPWPDVVIAAGRRTVPVARYLKRLNGGRTFLVQIMWPGHPVKDLDLVAVPRHDRVPDLPNVMRILGAPHRVTAERIAAEAVQWRDYFSDLPRPYITVLVGGAVKGGVFDAEAGRTLGRQAAQLARQAGGSLFVTTSRRTGIAVRNAMMAEVDVPAYLHIWTRKGENPYFAFLGLVDAIVVTGDSTSMCTEACATGRPVYIFSPPGMAAPKHERFHAELYEQGYARPLTGEFAPWQHPPLNPALDIARRIRDWIEQKRNFDK